MGLWSLRLARYTTPPRLLQLLGPFKVASYGIYTVMSLLIRYWCIPFYFFFYITLPLSQIPQPHNVPVQPPTWLTWAFVITHSPHLLSLALLIHRTIGLALCIDCTGDLWTSLLCFPFRTGPHVVFLMIISFSDLLICHCRRRSTCYPLQVHVIPAVKEL